MHALEAILRLGQRVCVSLTVSVLTVFSVAHLSGYVLK